MIEGWKKVKFSELFKNPKKSIISGPFGSNLKANEYQLEGVPLVRLQNIDRFNFIDQNRKFISIEKSKELSNHSYKVGDILITKLGAPLGKACIAPENAGNGIILADIVRVRLDDNSENKNFIVYQLNSDYIAKQLESLTTGATRPRVTLNDIRNLELLLPPLIEQEQIVEKLDKAFAFIDQAKTNIERNIENAKELFQSKLNEIFSQKGEGWEEKTLKDISIEFGRGKSKHRPRNDNKLFGGSYPFIQTGDVRKAHKRIETYSQTYNEVGLNQSKLWPKNTICITIAANIAETAILEFDACFPDSIIGLIVDNKKANLEYTYFALQYLKEELKALGKGSAQDNINLGTFEKQYFSFPDINTQSEIAKKLNALQDRCFNCIDTYKKKVASLNEIKKSFLHNVFHVETK